MNFILLEVLRYTWIHHCIKSSQVLKLFLKHVQLWHRILYKVLYFKVVFVFVLKKGLDNWTVHHAVHPVAVTTL